MTNRRLKLVFGVLLMAALLWLAACTTSDSDDKSDNQSADQATDVPTAEPTPLPAIPPADQPAEGCGAPATLIHAIQGTDLRSLESGQKHTVEGVVVADFQDTRDELGAFFIQEEDAEADDDPATSEGLMVFDDGFGVDVQVGDVVRVEGTVMEFASDLALMTELRRVTAVTVCDSGASVTPATVTLPVMQMDDWEAFEGMLVTLPQDLVVTENYNLGRYGQMMLAFDGRLYNPTNVARPGPDADAVKAANDQRRIILDDGSNDSNPDPVPYPPGGLSGTNTIRPGDTVSGLLGVVEHSFGDYRIHPVQPPVFTTLNPRPAAPDDVGGRVRVASFNVLNYFNGDGLGGGFPTSRGATTSDEFDRQRAKIISAILALDADIVGLMEIENDGDGPESAIADLVNGLNDAAGDSVYAYVTDPAGFDLPIPDSDEGADEIKVALIYRPATVTPVGDPLTTLDAPFDIRRPPLAQTFEETATGEQFMVVVNHLKSKSCTGARGADQDQDDLQSCFNAERTQAAQTLAAWLATDPAGTGDPDVLLIGDLNAYALEDPLIAFADAGYVNVLKQSLGDTDYSYVYFGEAGTLDHALASPELAAQVSGAGHWHINTDEPPALDYNVEYKSDGQIVGMYDPGPYRSSDHDPVVIGLALGTD